MLLHPAVAVQSSAVVRRGEGQRADRHVPPVVGGGRGRLDLRVRWSMGVDAEGRPRGEDRHAIELKVWRGGERDPLPSGLEQLDRYLSRLALSTGTLLLFDARPGSPQGASWATRGVSTTEVTPGGREVTVWRL
jgi:hypothetical protein